MNLYVDSWPYPRGPMTPLERLTEVCTRELQKIMYTEHVTWKVRRWEQRKLAQAAPSLTHSEKNVSSITSAPFRRPADGAAPVVTLAAVAAPSVKVTQAAPGMSPFKAPLAKGRRGGRPRLLPKPSPEGATWQPGAAMKGARLANATGEAHGSSKANGNSSVVDAEKANAASTNTQNQASANTPGTSTGKDNTASFRTEVNAHTYVIGSGQWNGASNSTEIQSSVNTHAIGAGTFNGASNSTEIQTNTETDVIRAGEPNGASTSTEIQTNSNTDVIGAEERNGASNSTEIQTNANSRVNSIRKANGASVSNEIQPNASTSAHATPSSHEAAAAAAVNANGAPYAGPSGLAERGGNGGVVCGPANCALWPLPCERSYPGVGSAWGSEVPMPVSGWPWHIVMRIERGARGYQCPLCGGVLALAAFLALHFKQGHSVEGVVLQGRSGAPPTVALLAQVPICPSPLHRLPH